MNEKSIYIPIDEKKNAIYVYLNYWLKSFDTSGLNQPFRSKEKYTKIFSQQIRKGFGKSSLIYSHQKCITQHFLFRLFNNFEDSY